MFRLTPITLSVLLLALLLVPVTGFAGTKSKTSAATDLSLLRFANKLHAITLTSSDIAQSAATMRQAYPDLIAYQTHVIVAGNRLNYLRLGFFASKDEARATLATVRSWYPDAYVTEIATLEKYSALGVDLDALAQVAARKSQAAAPPSARPPVSARPPAGYALHLDVAANPQFAPPTLPPTLNGYHLYVQRHTSTQGVAFHLNLGVFADRNSAEQARNQLLARYPQAVLREVSAGEKTQVATLPAKQEAVVAAKSAAPAVAAPLPIPSVAVKPVVAGVAAKTAAVVMAAIPTPDAATKPAVSTATVKPAEPVATAQPAPVVAVNPAMPEVATKPVVPEAAVKSVVTKPAPVVVAKSAVPEETQPAPNIVEKPAVSVVAAKPAAAGANDAESQARTLLDRAQDQIIARQFDAAVKILSEILSLPKNIYTADAMEYTGLAYDQAGKAKQAIQQYKEYLRLYPDSRSVYRVRQRMQTLQKG